MRTPCLLTILFLIIAAISACASTFSPQTTSPPITPLPNQQPPIPDLPQAPKLAPTVTEASVTRVVDGDTIEVSIKGSSYTVRYIGVDTPETVHPEKPVEYFGKEASNKNKELVAGKTVRLEKDVSETDKYGRLLRYVYVGDLFVNAELVRLGYAQVATYPPDVKYSDLFLRLQHEAKEAGSGLWAASVITPNPTTPTPTPPPSPVPSTITNVKITKIFYDGVVPRIESDEYVEIMNQGSQAVDLKGWGLKDISDGSPSFSFPYFILQPGKSIRVYTNEIHPEYGGFSFGKGSAIWNNTSHDIAALFNARGQEVSRKSY